MFTRSHAVRIATVCTLLSSAMGMLAQGSLTRVLGSFEQDTPLPETSNKPLGYADATALAVLAAYRIATGGAGWAGMAATGTISFTGSTASLPATLLSIPGNRAKLDVSQSAGHSLTVYNGDHGSVTLAGTNKVYLTPQGAAAGLAPFDLPLLAAAGGTSYSIIDHDVITLQGMLLRRITVEVGIARKDLYPYQTNDRSVIDMYFDPTTHLLTKTVSLIPVPGDSRPVLQKVDNYSGYQLAGHTFVPGMIAELINGQPVWTLVLTSFNVDTLPTITDFAF